MIGLGSWHFHFNASHSPAGLKGSNNCVKPLLCGGCALRNLCKPSTVERLALDCIRERCIKDREGQEKGERRRGKKRKKERRISSESRSESAVICGK